MSELFNKFKIGNPINEDPHYELYIEGDCNDADYIDRNSDIFVDELKNNEFLMYFISYMASAGPDFIKEDKDWKNYFDDSDFYWEYLPKETRGFDVDIHKVTKVKLTFVSGTLRYPVSIPSWDTDMFKDEEDKNTKLNEAFLDYKRKEKERLDKLNAEECEKLENGDEL